MIPVILTITGSDSTGSTGIQADIKTIAELGGYAVSAVTCISMRDISGEINTHDLPAEVIINQTKDIVSQFHPKSMKIGLIHGSNTIRQLRNEIIGCKNIVCSPGILSSDGIRLLSDAEVEAIKKHIIPISNLLMLRCNEAELILGDKISSDDDMIAAADKFTQMGAEWVLLRGGMITQGRITALLYNKGDVRFFTSFNIEGWQRHGVVGALSAAVATRLGMGDDMLSAITIAHEYIHSQVVYAVDNKEHSMRPADIYNKFVSLIFKHYSVAHDVQFYANELSITPRYLSQVTDKMVGKSPKQVINHYIMQKAKVLLCTTRLTIQEIALRLGFTSQSRFCKFFKNNEGKTPSDFR
ncbi:MAG: bifunctional hydroxymethylpyrimidine kinase/phosphomethylpyrimidine kinase [Candidatus Limimorpha sp.]